MTFLFHYTDATHHQWRVIQVSLNLALEYVHNLSGMNMKPMHCIWCVHRFVCLFVCVCMSVCLCLHMHACMHFCVHVLSDANYLCAHDQLALTFIHCICTPSHSSCCVPFTQVFLLVPNYLLAVSCFPTSGQVQHTCFTLKWRKMLVMTFLSGERRSRSISSQNSHCSCRSSSVGICRNGSQHGILNVEPKDMHCLEVLLSI